MKPRRSSDSDLRPIDSRALKSAMDTLRPHLSGSRVLDLFAGSGRFAFAALEEGAESAELVEGNRARAGDLSRACPPGSHVSPEEVFRYLKRACDAGTRFDIIFADPPFPLWNEDFASALFAGVAKVTSRGGIFLVKQPKRVVASLAAQGFLCWKSAIFGDSKLTYFHYGEKQKG